MKPISKFKDLVQTDNSKEVIKRFDLFTKKERIAVRNICSEMYEMSVMKNDEE